MKELTPTLLDTRSVPGGPERVCDVMGAAPKRMSIFDP
jgi:hypothetical protein